MATYLPPAEITEKILSRLPAKALLRFKGVSKSWDALISTHPFIRTHFLQSSSSHIQLTKKQLSLFRFRQGTFHTLPLPTPPTPFMICSCNGVLLLVCGQELLLWNPSMRNTTNVLCYASFTCNRRIRVLRSHRS